MALNQKHVNLGLHIHVDLVTMFVLCEHMTATDCSTATGCSTGDVDILLHSPHTPHSHMEAIKHHYLNLDIQQRLYLLVFR